jgi:hypothetical protein
VNLKELNQFEAAVESINPPVNSVVLRFENIELLLVNFDSSNVDETIYRQKRSAGYIASQQ